MIPEVYWLLRLVLMCKVREHSRILCIIVQGIQKNVCGICQLYSPRGLGGVVKEQTFLTTRAGIPVLSYLYIPLSNSVSISTVNALVLLAMNKSL